MSNIITTVHDFGSIQVAEGVDEQGGVVFAVLGDPAGAHGCSCPSHAPHEQLGHLPITLGPAVRSVRRPSSAEGRAAA